ncbi:MAG: N-acetyltransferase [Methylorubrum populi]
MNIRPERPDDIADVQAVTAAAFKDAPYSEQTEPAIITALREADALSLSLVADDDGEVIGHVAFSPVTIDGKSGKWFGLGPVSVEPNRQRRGIGKALICAGLDQLRSFGADGCVVLGDPDYYGRFGFVSGSDLTYEGVPAPYFQSLVFGGEKPNGLVAYHPGFAAR